MPETIIEPMQAPVLAAYTPWPVLATSWNCDHRGRDERIDITGCEFSGVHTLPTLAVW